MKKGLFVCLVILMSMGLFTGVRSTISQEFRGIQVTPDHEKRSCIQEVDGYAFLSEDMTLAQTRSAAFATAKRQALEMAQTFIESKTKMENFVMKFDEVTSSTQGAVTILEQKDLGIEDNTRYHVWIKAEVEYVLSPKGGAAAEPDEVDRGKPLTVKVWTSKKNIRTVKVSRYMSAGTVIFMPASWMSHQAGILSNCCPMTIAGSISLNPERFTKFRTKRIILI